MWWIKDLQLALSDRNALLSGKELTDAIIHTSQTLLHHQFPKVKGLQDTTLSHLLSFAPARRNSVQILKFQVLRSVNICNCILSVLLFVHPVGGRGGGDRERDRERRGGGGAHVLQEYTGIT